MRGRWIPLALALTLALLCACGGQTDGGSLSAPLPDVSVPAQAGTGPSVYTDWSKLEEYQPPEPVYRRYHDGPTYQLTQGEDYGPLIQFQSGRYGLMTLDGRVVVDPVYHTAGWFYADTGTMSQRERLPIQFLGMAVPQEDLAIDPFAYTIEYTLAAEDGSWVTQDYALLTDDSTGAGNDYAHSTQGVLVTDRDRRDLILLGVDGREVHRWTPKQLPLLRTQKTQWGWSFGIRWSEEDLGLVTTYGEGARYYVLDGDRVVAVDPAVTDISGFCNGLALARSNDTFSWGYVDHNGDFAIPPGYDEATDFFDGVAVVTRGDQSFLIDTQGVVLAPLGTGFHPQLGVEGDVGWFHLSGDSTQERYLRWNYGAVEEYPVQDGWRLANVLWRPLETGGAELLGRAGPIVIPFRGTQIVDLERYGDRLIVATANGDGYFLCDLGGQRLAGPYPSMGYVGEGLFAVSMQQGGILLYDSGQTLLEELSGYLYLYTLDRGTVSAKDALSHGVRRVDGTWLVRILNELGDF